MITRRLLGVFACLFAAVLLSACSPSEADQRKAFIAFLRDDVLSKTGLRLPQPDAEKQKSFGAYAEHYAVITRFHERMNASVAKPMQETLAKSMPRSIEDIVTRKADLVTVRSGFVGMREALDQALAAAGSEKAALKQPEDLASVFAAVYDKAVTAPTTAFRQVFPTADDAFAAIIALADLIESNRKAIKLNGSQMEISNPALRTKVQAALEAMNAKQRGMTEAQQTLRRAVFGN
ncbi:hypothetical protein J2Y55_002479 [Bosea sp. BE125]|uniref:DUF3053 family protein n=1 Tax=Bosea sp. BE125 TaxID=2817909 RepID=UPI00285DD476|nr:DUF3053 family protein [Bosea sp. BE125]MDR6871467.1 hypothetical protein [Bosea sp. BE125]